MATRVPERDWLLHRKPQGLESADARMTPALSAREGAEAVLLMIRHKHLQQLMEPRASLAAECASFAGIGGLCSVCRVACKCPARREHVAIDALHGGS